MTTARVEPGVAHGSLRAPPSKSYTHRALVAGFLANRPYQIDRPLVSDDTLATRRGLATLGATVVGRATRWNLRPREGARSRPVRVDCGESGTTFRFLTAVAAAQSRRVTLVGRPGLARRPIEGLVAPLEARGATARTVGRRSLPLEIDGPIHPGRFLVDGSTSSQFVSALLLVLPTLPGRSSLLLRGDSVSRPYIDATLAVLAAHGIRIGARGRGWQIDGPQSFAADGFPVPGDASSAAYLWAAAAVTGGRVEVRGVARRWPQADRRILEVLERAGASVVDRDDRVVVEGPLETGIDVDLTDSPDLYPLVGTVAATIPKRSMLRGAAHVVLKESDRRTATARLVRAVGGSATVGPRGLRIIGTRRPKRFAIAGVGDHRIAMSAAVGALVARGPCTISDAGCVRKSYPAFWTDLRSIGAEVSVGR